MKLILAFLLMAQANVVFYDNSKNGRSLELGPLIPNSYDFAPNIGTLNLSAPSQMSFGFRLNFDGGKPPSYLETPPNPYR
jgi:hypothetical protein